MLQIPQSTSRVVMLKLFLTGTTTAATGKTLAITISKNGGAFANPNAGATNATEVSSGWYKVTMDTTDTNTVGDLVVRGTATSCDDSERVLGVVKATNGGLTAIPDTAATTNASLLTSGTGTDQISVSAGKVLLQATQSGVTIPTVTTVTNQLTAAAIATGVWTDTTAGDFTVALSIGKSILNGVTLGTGLTINAYTGNTVQTGDSFARIGLAGVGLTNVVLPSGGLANVTAWTVAITGNVTGNLSGSVGSVTGAVGSVTGAVGSVTAGVNLASTGLDSIATTAPAGVASTFREMVVQTWRKWFKKAILDADASTLVTYADDGTTPITTQTVTTVGNVETQGPSS